MKIVVIGAGCIGKVRLASRTLLKLVSVNYPTIKVSGASGGKAISLIPYEI